MKKIGGQFLAILLSVIILTIAVMPASVKAVKTSSTEYTVTMENAVDIYVGNKVPVNAKKGKEVYLVYTVDSVDKKATTSYQHGVVGSDDGTAQYPYENGGIFQFNMTPCLMDVGYTYFYKFSVNDDGFDCVVVKAKGKEKSYVNFTSTYGEATDDYKFFGIWLGCGNATAKLTHVMCYDESGKDLGVYGSTVKVREDAPMQYDKQVQHAYNVTAKNASNVALCNAKKTDSDIIYMEYTVKSTDSNLYQTGVVSTNKPTNDYPHNSGILVYDYFPDKPGNGYLLEEGASYIIRFVKGEDSFYADVQKTKNGVFEYYTFPNQYGTYDAQAPYIGLWFGENPNYQMTAEIVNMKCYDENGNNLGIRCNQSVVNIDHLGEKEDYSSCEAMYYCEETETLIALYADTKGKVVKEDTTEEIQYRIWDRSITLMYEDGKECYDYLYQKIYDDDVTYVRLGTYYVEFETGTDTKIERQTVNTDTGYTAMKPAAPVREDAEFEGWVTADGKDYDFDAVVTESLTLYAKWSDGIAYVNADVKEKADITPYVMCGASVCVLAAGVLGCVSMVRRNKRHEK